MNASANSKIDNEEYFKALKTRPFIAWPTILLMLASFSVIASSWTMVLNEIIPLWVGFVLNVIAYYFLFSPIHDGSHRSLSNNDKLNDFLMEVAFIPYTVCIGNSAAARTFHMQHHRHTGLEGLDPDIVISSKGRNALSWWFIWGSQYRPYFKKYKKQLPIIKRPSFARTRLLVALLVLGFLIWLFPLEMLVLWFMALLAGSPWTTAFVFSYLPHHVHKRKECEDPLDEYQVTCNITGYEWLLSPLMQYQNYHLAHHLYPTVPFYRMVKIWNARLSQHLAHNPADIRLG